MEILPNRYQTWDWYLMRAANTTLKFGAPSVGVMDDTVFREILNALMEEAEADPSRTDFATAASQITANMFFLQPIYIASVCLSVCLCVTYTPYCPGQVSARQRAVFRQIPLRKRVRV